ncbi:MAG TPA: cyclase family protein [Pseudonocardiaceae bacterium]
MADDDYLFAHRNWGRWGAADERGAVNLVTQERSRSAATLVRSGESISLSRQLVPPSRGVELGTPGVVTEHLAGRYHGSTVTHVDALCHVWSGEGMWGGRTAAVEIGCDGSEWADVANMRDGIVTRGVLLDIPALRGEPYVSTDRPVSAVELDAAASRQGVEVRTGDALVLYCGRDVLEAQGHEYQDPNGERAGVGESCVRFVREHDVALVLWDMLEARSDQHVPFGAMHGVLWAFGVPLVDNCDLGRLVARCRAEGRYEFLLMLAPLVLAGGTGSPVNPLAVL